LPRRLFWFHKAVKAFGDVFTYFNLNWRATTAPNYQSGWGARWGRVSFDLDFAHPCFEIPDFWMRFEPLRAGLSSFGFRCLGQVL